MSELLSDEKRAHLVEVQARLAAEEQLAAEKRARVVDTQMRLAAEEALRDALARLAALEPPS